MAKLPRKTAGLFAENAAKIPKFGSLVAGTPEFTKDLDLIQSLPAFLTGWFGATIDDNAPTIEDMDSLFFVLFRQIAYLMQAGIPEFSSTETYYVGSVTRNSEVVFMCIFDDGGVGIKNKNLYDFKYWKKLTRNEVVTISADLTIQPGMSDDIFLVDSTRGKFKCTLPPTPTKNLSYTIKDSGFMADVNPITIARTPGQKIEGLDADFICDSKGGVWRIISDGANWFFI